MLAALSGRIYDDAPQQNAFSFSSHFGVHLGRPLLLIAAGALLAPSGAAGQSVDALLVPGRADKVRNGMKVESLFDLYGAANVRLVQESSEGTSFPVVQVYTASEPTAPAIVARILQRCGRSYVSGITVHSPAFRTPEGLGVGSTVGEIRRRFPRASLNREHAPSVIVDSLQMTFGLPGRRAQFADTVRVISVWMWSPLPDSLTGPCR